MAHSFAPVPALQNGGARPGVMGPPARHTDHDTVPAYLRVYYWWAYVHPYAVKFFERQWLINLILWGNYARLRDAVLDEFGQVLSGATLQIACAYGDLSVRLAERVAQGQGSLDIVDVLPIQLQNLRNKLSPKRPVRCLKMDSSELRLPEASYDRALLFFLLHEQPAHVRLKTLREAFRVVKPGGTIVIMDYARPSWWHPLRYLWRPLLATLEPFALDLWREDVCDWLPDAARGRIRSKSFFGGLYRMITVTR
jgi:ubiquinone/menaquinone biosynthesis C-methylase UbiE